jgi:MFS transporter, DHA1 family, multidrug resistance protein
VQCAEIAAPACDVDDKVDKLILVDWKSPTDNANPKNWSLYKKLRVYLIINYANAAVYMSSSIYAASQEGVMHDFHVSQTIASLGLALFVLGYGLGPIVFSPLADNARIGRNPPYVISSIIFLILSILTATARDVTSLLILRLLQGFFGSPVLSFGGASLSDICHPDVQPIALYTWACSGFAAPSIAPIISGFAIPVLGWRWSLWEIVIVNGPAVILMVSVIWCPLRSQILIWL